MDVARVLLADTLEDAFAARAFDANSDAGILRLEGLGDAFGDRQIDGGVPHRFAFLLGSGSFLFDLVSHNYN